MSEIEEFLVEIGVKEEDVPEAMRFLVWETTIPIDMKTDSLIEGKSMSEVVREYESLLRYRLGLTEE